MFSFHKPKVYRSSAGCCICKAKSSSSRFTDSKKYEDDFMECFQLQERRSGEICNACVLLVKRWKKLPTGSERNWNHVVDARAGPGTKSLTKFKAKNKKKKLKAEMKKEGSIKKKHVYIKHTDAERAHSPDAYSDEITGEDMLSEDLSMPPSLAPSPSPSEDGDGEIPMVKKRRHRSRSPQRKSGTKRRSSPEFSSFLDLKLWKREEVCCGIVFRGPNEAVVIDLNFWKPCSGDRRHHRKEAVTAGDVLEQDQGPVVVAASVAAVAVAAAAASSSVTSAVTSVQAVTSPETSPLQSPQPLAAPAPASAPAPLDTSMKVIAVAARSDASNGVSKTFSDSSSDSGYDESSNQGVSEAAIEFANRSHLQPVEVRAD